MQPYAWSWDPHELAVAAALAVAYVSGVRRLGVRPWRIACFAVGLALLLSVLITPLDTLALHFLLVAHLLQNVALAEWAPALCVLGLSPALAAALARPRGVSLLTHPFVALPLWLGTYFAWHLPWAYDAALRHQDSLLHLEHACYFAAGVLVWWPVLHDAPHRLRSGARAAYVFAAFVLASPLGLLLALLPSPVYDFYERAPRLWGLSALEDQQLAGLTMAAEQAVVLFAAFAVFFARFLAEEEATAEPAR
jgi:putative membrane protein